MYCRAGSHSSKTTRFDSYEIKPASQTSSRAKKEAATSDQKKRSRKSSSEGKASQTRRTSMSINLLSSLIRNLSRAPTDSADLKTQASFVLPIIPENEFEFSIATKPSFKEKHTPASSYMFFIVNLIILGTLITGAVLYAT